MWALISQQIQPERLRLPFLWRKRQRQQAENTHRDFRLTLKSRWYVDFPNISPAQNRLWRGTWMRVCNHLNSSVLEHSHIDV